MQDDGICTLVKQIDAKTNSQLSRPMSGFRLRMEIFVALFLAVAVSAKAEISPAAPPFKLQINPVILAPTNPANWPSFREQLRSWRDETKKVMNYDDSFYERPEFAWSRSNFVCGFAMMCDLTFYDPEKGDYQVDAFLAHGLKEFGGYDSVVLWHAYPRIGFDQRNQFDFYRDMPGGMEGLRQLSRQFHAQNVKVLINYNPWDVGTRREGKPDLEVLAELVEDIEADGIFLDTLPKVGAEFRSRLDAARPGVVLEPEIELPLAYVADHHMSWAQGFVDSHPPGVLMLKYFERRHMMHQINRWTKDHSGELQMAWMNGSGMLVWENVFGSWVGWSPRDRSVLRSMVPIQRRYARLFAGEEWTPLVETQATDVYASLWEGDGLRLWTLCNRDNQRTSGKIMLVPHIEGERYFDLMHGVELEVTPSPEGVVLEGTIEPRGIGCFLAVRGDLEEDLEQFLAQQAAVDQRRDGDTDSPVRNETLKKVVSTKRYSRDNLPEGMVCIDGGVIDISVSFTERECGTYQTPHKRKVILSPYAVDITPVTNEQYDEFLRVSGYKPRHEMNFLKHWNDGRPPAGKEDHPVVYIDLEDARAYAHWAGKRLLTEEEMQYAAQGPEGLNYPWGNEMKPGVCNDGRSNGTKSVFAFPEGRSPFGCYDMCGNVWEWTESERSDGRTRFCILHGGSYFKAQGSKWYTDGGPVPCQHAAKFLLMWPGLDRCSTIGFRCAVDLGER